MKRQRALIASGAGLGSAVLCLIALREFTRDFFEGLPRASDGELRGPLTWFLLLGVLVGGAALAARYHYLVAAVPAAVLFLVYLPLLIDFSAPSWYPDWLRDMAVLGFGPTPYIIIGAFAAAAGIQVYGGSTESAQGERHWVHGDGPGQRPPRRLRGS